MEEVAFERNLKDVRGFFGWHGVASRKKAVPGKERAVTKAQSCGNGVPTLPVCEMPHSWLSPQSAPEVSPCILSPPWLHGHLPSDPFLLGTLSLSFNDIKTKRLTLVLDFNGANVLPFYSDFLVKLEMRVFLL